MICLFNKYKKSVQKRTDFFDNSFFNAVPDKPLATRNKPHNNQLCADLSRFFSAYPVVSHFLRFAWQTTSLLTAFEYFTILFELIIPKAMFHIWYITSSAIPKQKTAVKKSQLFFCLYTLFSRQPRSIHRLYCN